MFGLVTCLMTKPFGRSCVIFPGSHAVRSCVMLVTEGSHDLSCVRLCDRFPWSCVLGVTWLELGLGAVVKQLVTVRWILGSFGNTFLVGVSFTHNSSPATPPHVAVGAHISCCHTCTCHSLLHSLEHLSFLPVPACC